MRYFTIPPPGILAKYVHYFWVHEFALDNDAPFTYYSTADSSPKILFHYQGSFDEITSADRRQKSSSAYIQGQTQGHATFITHETIGIFGVYLFPSSLSSLFALPARELTNQLIDLKTLLGQKGNELEEQMLTAKTTKERLAVITRFFAKQLKYHNTHTSPMQHALHEIIQAQGQVSIKQLADKYYLSERQFERTFAETSGFSPKTYARIVRFEAALNSRYHGKSFTQIAHDLGYYDQSHFIRDFKAFSGHAPENYFSSLPQSFLSDLYN